MGGLAPRMARSSARVYEGKCRKEVDEEWRTEGVSARVVVRMRERFGVC